jgi:hypothetical protein
VDLRGVGGVTYPLKVSFFNSLKLGKLEERGYYLAYLFMIVNVHDILSFPLHPTLQQTRGEIRIRITIPSPPHSSCTYNTYQSQ